MLIYGKIFLDIYIDVSQNQFLINLFVKILNMVVYVIVQTWDKGPYPNIKMDIVKCYSTY
jgi:hypothetical protein